MKRWVVWAAVLGVCASVSVGFAAKAPKKPRRVDPMLEARAVCDSLAGVARWREGVVVRTREDRMPFCGENGLVLGWTVTVEVGDEAGKRGVEAARDLELWLRARGWQFADSCFTPGPPERRAAFTRGGLGCSFNTSPLERDEPVAEGAYAPGYLLTLGVVVRESPR